MEIIRIFEDSNKLFAFKYKGDKDNIYDKTIDLWTDVFYVRSFLIKQKKDLPKGKTIDALVDKVLKSAEKLDDTIIYLGSNEGNRLEELFKPLDNLEQNLDIVLSKQKGAESYLRIYALKIDTNLFVITGSTIKFTKYLDERNHTQEQVLLLDKCRNYLRDNDVMDSDSFFEFLDQN